MGGAAAGLLLLEDEGLATDLDPARSEALRERQLRPHALVGAGLALARSGATAMIDVSDGIGADAGHIAAASGVRCVLELGEGCVAPGVAEVAEAAGQDALTLASGGEDYELLAAVPEDRLEEAFEAVREPPATRHWRAGSRLGRVWSLAALQAAKFRMAGSTRFAHELVASPLDHRQLAKDLLRDQRRINGVGVLCDFSLELGHGWILVGGCLFFVGQ